MSPSPAARIVDSIAAFTSCSPGPHDPRSRPQRLPPATGNGRARDGRFFASSRLERGLHSLEGVGLQSEAAGLFERHHLSVFRFLRRMTGSLEQAEDLTQE